MQCHLVNIQSRHYLSKLLADIRSLDRGQGLNNAIQDAANYIEAIKKISEGISSAAAAISAYDAEVLERGKREIHISAASSVATHDLNRFTQGPMFKMGFRQSKAADVIPAVSC